MLKYGPLKRATMSGIYGVKPPTLTVQHPCDIL